MIRITYFHRKKRALANYSIEGIFERVRADLAGEVESKVVISPFVSNGLFRRLGNITAAKFSQSTVNHVTGDTNYLTLGLDRDRTVLTNHDCSFMTRASGWRREALRKFWLQWPIDHCRYVTTVSEASKRDLLTYVDCDPAKIHVVHNAIDPAFSLAAMQELGDPVRILQVGTAVNKNIERLAAALTGLPVCVCVVGRLNESQAAAMRQHNVTYESKTNLSAAEIRQLYVATDIVTFASIIEGFGLPILEAQATGRPVITSNVSSMPEVAGSGACLIDPFNVESMRQGFRRLIDDKEYRETIVNSGLANITRFDGKKIANQYLGLYQKIATGDT